MIYICCNSIYRAEFLKQSCLFTLLDSFTINSTILIDFALRVTTDSVMLRWELAARKRRPEFE